MATPATARSSSPRREKPSDLTLVQRPGSSHNRRLGYDKLRHRSSSKARCTGTAQFCADRGGIRPIAWTNESGKPYFGGKMHVGIDEFARRC